MDQMCFPCDEEDAEISSEVRTLLMAAAIVVVLLLLFAAYRLYLWHAARGEKRDAGLLRWVKPSFSGGGTAPLAIYAKICVRKTIRST